MKFTRLTILLVILSILLPVCVFARVGVGVGTGMIDVRDALRPGGVYNLGDLLVFNTGDEGALYKVNIAYLGSAKELRPEEAWFKFGKEEFYLDPAKGENISIRLQLPLKVTPGRYFAFVEASPKMIPGKGTTIGVAAASKLYFNVAPANWFMGIYYRLLSLAGMYKKWIYIILALVAVIAVVKIFKKYVHIQVGIKK